MSNATTSNSLNIVKRIGAGARLTESATSDIVATAPDGFDYKARGAVTDLIHAWAGNSEKTEPVKIGKAGSQRATDYGRGVDALAKTVKRAFAALAADPDAPAEMRVSLKGVGSAVVPADHPAYALLLALMGADVPAETDAPAALAVVA